MNTKMLRRISGLILLLAGIAYLVAWHFEYDLPKYDLPSEIRTPGFLIGYVSVLVFCFWLLGTVLRRENLHTSTKIAS